MRRTYLFLPLVLLAGRAPAGEIKEVDTALNAGNADTYIGMEYRADVARAGDATQRGDDQAAWAALKDVLAFCDRQTGTDDTRIYSVRSDREANEYRAEAAEGVTTTFVDHACPSGYKLAAFLAVRAGQNDAAFAYLDRAQAIAPHWAEPLTERAYLVGKLGDRQRSLALYQEAMRITERYTGSTYLKPMILRGMGFALTELGRLPEARQAYEASLVLEPDNALAKNELIYISQVEAKASSAK